MENANAGQPATGFQHPINLPAWVPVTALHYLAHTEQGLSIREVARKAGVHPSTVLRQIRKIEALRDDPLIDEALSKLGPLSEIDLSADKATPKAEKTAAAATHGFNEARAAFVAAPKAAPKSAPKSATYPEPSKTSATSSPVTTPKKDADMNAFCDPSPTDAPSAAVIEQEARRILRRLSEPGACLAVAKDMEKAVVVRDLPDGRTTRTAVLDRPIAQAMALKDWITCANPGRINRYHITQAGRAALKRLLAADESARAGFAEAPARFGDQHRDWDSRTINDPDTDRPKRVRYNAAESPILTLARRREKDGTPFLADDLVACAERLREDFELAQMGPRVTQNWDRFLTGGGDRGSFNPAASGPGRGPDAARDRVAAALADLGPGLGDVVLRCCCFLEGMEATEQHMGWSARSGKIVLRIALERLKRHYAVNGQSNLIG